MWKNAYAPLWKQAHIILSAPHTTKSLTGGVANIKASSLHTQANTHTQLQVNGFSALRRLFHSLLHCQINYRPTYYSILIEMGLGDSMGFKSIDSSQGLSMDSTEEAAVCICSETSPTQCSFICDTLTRYTYTIPKNVLLQNSCYHSFILNWRLMKKMYFSATTSQGERGGKMLIHGIQNMSYLSQTM